MSHLLRLIAGDKRNPTRTLAIANSSSTANIHLRSGGFSPGPGPKKVYWSGQTPRQDGQKRLGSSRDNSKQVISYDLNGGSAAELAYLQREITRFLEDAGLYEEEKTSTPCWLEYRWHDNLDDVPAPTFGQFSYYIKILDGGPPPVAETIAQYRRPDIGQC